jgi:2-keto-4-pentenoate hydratase/2-oxohepta-3-ene-1,7-dioic acid hydratase in catechol pathway
VHLGFPFPKSPKLVCMALNYMENAFLKSPTAVIGDGDTVGLSKDNATVFEHEAELGVVIGRRATKVNIADWKRNVFGCVNCIDVSSSGLGAQGVDSFF